MNSDLKFKLRTKPPQFVRGKTQETLCDISKIVLENYLFDDINNNIHTVNIVITNNSLVEVGQWKCRIDSKFKDHDNIHIEIISSKGGKGNYKNIEEYIGKLVLSKSKDDLPDILILCCNKKRVCDDISKLCKLFSGYRSPLTNFEEPIELRFNVYIDEPDANIGIVGKFLSVNKNYIMNNTITSVTFITATPMDNFWNMLNKKGIYILSNINKDSIYNFDDDLKNYRTIEEHHIIEHNNSTDNPLEYIMDLFNTGLINENERKCIYAPGHLYTETENIGSHNEIVAFFIQKGYVVLLINGKYKGFIYPDGRRETLKEYNIKNGFIDDIELKDTLSHWYNSNEFYLAITGNLSIQRGVTFNTNGFNFTDAILSCYHGKTLSYALQQFGRCNGGKEFVDIMNIYTTSDIRNKMKDLYEMYFEICSLQPEYFNKTDFDRTKNTIPVKAEIIDDKLLEKLILLIVNRSKNYKEKFHSLFVEGIYNGDIILYDNNNLDKFDITTRNINTIRMYKKGDKINARRFDRLSNAHDKFITMSQTCVENQYNIDFAKDTYIKDDFINNTNIFWITYKS